MNNAEIRMNDEKEMWSGNPRRSKNEVSEISERVDHHYNAGPVAEVTDFPEATEITCAENCASGAVPHRTQSKTGTKKIKIPDLVSMWKYMLSPKYANRRLALYTFLNKCLRRGQLSEIVGFRVMNRVINRDACNFTGVNFWKIDREEFYADVRVELTLRAPTGNRIWSGILVCWCSFDEKGFSMSVEELAESVDRKAEGLVLLSPFLVPYHTNQMMDTLTEKIWIEYNMPEAIGNPDLRNSTELARRMGLNIMYLDIYEHQEMDSIIFFADSDLIVGEDRVEKRSDGNTKVVKTHRPTVERIPANTIVVNTNIIRRDYSAFHIFHECIHYLLHYMFFSLQEMDSNDVRAVRFSEIEVEEGKELSDPIYFMEKQANRGAYGLMMPAGDTRKRVELERKRTRGCKNFGEQFEKIGKRLSGQLDLPHFRVKARMIQLGYIEAKGALNYVDRVLIRPFAFHKDAWRESEVTFVIKPGIANELYRKSTDFRTIINSGKYIYADGHIVRNESRFVKKEGNRLVLTDEAAGQVDDCCLRFVRRYVQKRIGEYIPGRMFYDAHYVEQTQFYLSDLINEKQMDELDAKMEYRDTFPRTFVDAFDMLMKKNGETRESIAPKLHTTERSLYNWLYDPEHKITADFVIGISLMWNLPDWISKMLLDRAFIRLSEYDRRHQALEHIRTVLWDQGIEGGNLYLISKGLSPLDI